MKRNKLFSIIVLSSLGVCGLLSGCSCKKEIDASKAYEYLLNAHENLKEYYEGDFNVISTYKYDLNGSVSLLSSASLSNETEEYNVVVTGDSDEKKYGEYVFNDTRIFESKYNVGDEVISMDEDEFVVKNTENNAYENFVARLYEENSSEDIKGYVISEIKKEMEVKLDDLTLEFNTDLLDLNVNSYLRKDVFTVDYTCSNNVNVNGVEAEFVASGKLQFDDENLLYTEVEFNLWLNNRNYEYKSTHQYSDEYVDPNEDDNILSGLQSMLDISFAHYRKMKDYGKSFALLIYHNDCYHCKALVNSFNYSKTVVYKIDLDEISNDEVKYLFEFVDEAMTLEVPTNIDDYVIATPAVVRFENGVVKYISYGNIDTSIQYNYDLLASIIEGTFTGDKIVYK